MNTIRRWRSWWPSAAAVILFAGCSVAAFFDRARPFVAALRLLVALAAFVLLLRMQFAQKRRTEQLLKKIGELADEMKREREEYAQKSAPQSLRRVSPRISGLN